jgi:phosphoribosylformylglycinamidine synthase
MAHRIEIALKAGVRDARGKGVVAAARRFFDLPLKDCRTRDVYKIDIPLNQRELREVRKAFTDPVIAVSALGRLRPPRFDWLVEIGFKPGVTDNVGRTARVVVEDLTGRKPDTYEEVYTGIQYFLTGEGLTRDMAWSLAREQLANPLIQTIAVCSPEEWAAAPVEAIPPVFTDHEPVDVRTYNLNVSDEALMAISRDGILSLSLEEMHAIRDHYHRPEVREGRAELGLPPDPTDVELEAIAQTWSEHCSHKIFAGRVRYQDEQGREEWIDSLFKTYIRGSTERIANERDWLVSVFTDNAGIVKFNDRFHVAYKVETHNSPSALDPYGGSITGIVGCNRDPMGTGMGCEMLYNVWGYCLGSPFYHGDLPEGLFHPRRIRDGVHRGVIDGGNQSGIPWARGFERFDDRYIGKPLVFCGTVGRIPVLVGGRPSERKEVEPGDVVVMAGGRIGKDGIHGATFSSEELRQESPAQAVQIGDPITQRKLYEFMIEARDLGLFRGVTDNGAGGLSCSVGEMGKMCGGADIDTAKAPLKYEGLQPWEILLSEAQERMTFAVPPDDLGAFTELAARRDVDVAALGRFTEDRFYTIRHEGRLVGRLDMAFLYEGCPRMTLEAVWSPPSIPAPAPLRAGPRNQVLRKLLSSLDLCSREFRSRVYDAEVKGLSVVKPFVGTESDMPSDATVLQVEYDAKEGLALAEGINPFFSDLDAYHMMTSIIDEAVRRIISVGGRPDHIAGLDNFCWPDPVLSPGTPDGPYKMAQLVRANKALYDITTAYGVPCVSGKDSMKNDSVRGGRKISIPPTVLFSAMGKMDDVRRAVTLPFKQAGDAVLAVGITRKELGASAFHRFLAGEQGLPGHTGGAVPKVDLDLARRLYAAMAQAIEQGLLRSSHTPSLGGIAAGLALCAMGGSLGAEIDLARLPIEGRLTDDEALFSESNSRFLVTCRPTDVAAVLDLFRDLPVAEVGTVNREARLKVSGQRGRAVVDSPLAPLRRAFKETLDGI